MTEDSIKEQYGKFLTYTFRICLAGLILGVIFGFGAIILRGPTETAIYGGMVPPYVVLAYSAYHIRNKLNSQD